MFGWGNRNPFPPIPWAHHQINVWLGLILLHPCSLLCLLLILAVIAILSLKRGIEIPHQFPILFSFFCPHPLSAFPNFFPSRFLLLLLVRPSGKLVQIEHALTAVGSGQTYLGIQAANGVVIATEKKLPSILVDETSVQKIQCLTPNIGVVYRFLFILQLSGKLGYFVLLVGDILDLINMHIALNCLKIKSAIISVFRQCLEQVPVHVHL
ncbi:uncharacterized protein [Gossypium hirsutum]|uniref:Uncharacterized protein isoform X1 n=1 Tax=Gossypium hirsutum TaxID=3635 RepID=A0ABM2ZV90_GOSHI|nr:uncharacterized protein LOC121215572 isoform X1 [Gossypium hirsutum]